MNQIILASHGGLAEGARDTLSMVLGDVSNVHVVTLARDDKEPVSKEVERLVESFDENDAVYVCTDMLGSSVNNSVVELMNNGAKITVISGMNMPLVLSLAVSADPLSAGELRAILSEARAGLVNCAEPEEPRAAPAKKRAVAGKGGKANIVLARLDYRLLHGQVVFSWVNSVAAQRIIEQREQLGGRAHEQRRQDHRHQRHEHAPGALPRRVRRPAVRRRAARHRARGPRRPGELR